MKNKNQDGIKKRILEEAVRLFSEKGFHGTSVRDIASSAECSLPMLYYYYQSKEDLFYEIAYTEFVSTSERLNREVKIGATPEETYFNAVKQKKELCGYDKAVYKLALKVWMGFEGDSRVRNDLAAWEKGRFERTKSIIGKYVPNKDHVPVFSDLFTRVIENFIEKIILLDEDIPDELIKAELAYLMKTIHI